jgi:hypothetical protein
MARKSVLFFLLLLLLIGIIALGVGLVRGRGDVAKQLSTGSPDAQTDEFEAGSNPKRFSKTREHRRRSAAIDPIERAPDPRDQAVSEDLARELNITDAERAQVNTLIAGIETNRRRLFDEVSNRSRTEEDVTAEMGELRGQLSEDIRDLLGDERATMLFEALR